MQHFHSQLWFLLQIFSVRAVNFVNFLFLLQPHNWPYNYYLGFLFTSQNHQNKQNKQNKMLIKKEKITLVNSTKVMFSKLKHTHTLSLSTSWYVGYWNEIYYSAALCWWSLSRNLQTANLENCSLGNEEINNNQIIICK